MTDPTSPESVDAMLRRFANMPRVETMCGERPDSGMGFWRMQHACVLERGHKGIEHEARDGTRFVLRPTRYRTVVPGSYTENVSRR